MSRQLRIIFAGTPDFATPSLRAIDGSGHRLLAVLTQPDRPAGRGRKLSASPVKQYAEKAGLPVLQPLSLKDEKWQQQLAELKADLMVVVAYGLMIPEAVLEMMPMGCLNVHPSLLPRWRGAAPIQRAIEAGDEITGVCIMKMDKGLDTGPVYHCQSYPVNQRTAGQLHDFLAVEGANLLLETIDKLAESSLELTPQAEFGVTYADKIRKEETRLDWSLSAVELEQKVRAFSPWPGSSLDLAGETVKILEIELLDKLATDDEPGTILKADKSGIDVACAKGRVRILRLQRPGGKPLTSSDYINARQDLKG